MIAPITIIKTTQLNPWQLDELEKLCETAAGTDGFNTHFYWNAMSNREGECITDFLLYINNELISALSLFLFEDNGIEICALTHPDHRKKGYFYRLFSESKIEIFSLDIKYCLFCCPKKSTPAKRLLKRLEATYQSSETHLVFSQEQYQKKLISTSIFASNSISIKNPNSATPLLWQHFLRLVFNQAKPSN